MAEEHIRALRNKAALTLLDLLLTYNWHECTLALIAEKAKVSKEALCCEFKKTADIIPAIVNIIDDKLDEALQKQENNEILIDALFDSLMTRFEIMQPYRNSIIKLAHIARQTPDCALAFYQAHKVTIKRVWSFIHKNDATITCDTLKMHTLLLIYHYSFLAWERDQSHDLSATMTALDHGLKKTNKLNLFAT